MGSGYVRQSAAEIVDDEIVYADPLNAEFNALVNFAHGTLGHVHDGTTGEGPPIPLETSVTGVLQVENGGINGIHKTDATTNPTATDDSASGYNVGSIWVNTATDKFFICGDATVGAAVWITESSLDPDLSAIAAISTTGFLVRTASNTWTTRSITGAGSITVTNGDAVSGNPIISITAATTSAAGSMSSTDKTKLDGIAAGATVNSSDASLRDRTTHTGEQAISTITGLQSTLDSKQPSATVGAAVATAIGTATGKTTPVDNDHVALADSAASYGLKSLTWSNIKATLKTYFDTIYALASHTHSAATTSVAGFMSSTDKTKMDALGTNGYGTRTISTSTPSGGSDGDIWYQV